MPHRIMLRGIKIQTHFDSLLDATLRALQDPSKFSLDPHRSASMGHFALVPLRELYREQGYVGVTQDGYASLAQALANFNSPVNGLKVCPDLDFFLPSGSSYSPLLEKREIGKQEFYFPTAAFVLGKR